MLKKIVLIGMILVSSLFSAEINWAKDYRSGMKQALKENKPVLLVSSRHSCKYCVILKDTTFKDKDIIKALNKDFISIIAYSDEQDYMPRELFTPGVPALWFLVPDGQAMYQPLMGAIKTPEFMNALSIVKETFEEYKKTAIKTTKDTKKGKN